MIRCDGWTRHNTWGASADLRTLYERRCRRQAEEMDAHAQAAELLAPRVAPGDVLLDAGCGGGYFFHSLRDRAIPATYWGVDATASLLDIGRRVMPQYGLPAERLLEMRLEDLDGAVDHVVCINVLTYLDHDYRPLERLLKMARKSVILRESVKDGAERLYVRDRYLDPGVDIKVPINHFDRGELLAFIGEYGFNAETAVDRRTGGKPEMVIDYPHYWTFVVADRLGAAASS